MVASPSPPAQIGEPKNMPTPDGSGAATAEARHFVYAHRGFQYALAIGDVLEIVQAVNLLPFHGSMSGVLGNMVHREHLLPVLDSTALVTSLGPAPDHPVNMVVVVQRDGVLCALALDRYVSVVPLGAAADDGAPALAVGSAPLEDTPGDSPLVERVLLFLGNTLMVLSVEALVLMVRRGFGHQQAGLEASLEGGPAQALATAAAAAQGYLFARVGRTVLGIPIESVIEVLEHYEVMPLFLVDPTLRGLINLRGHVLAVLDLSPDIDLPLRTLEEVSQFIVVRADDAEFALCVDKVVGLKRIRREQIQGVDAMFTGDLSRYLAGVHQADSGPVFIITVADVLALPRLQPFLGQSA